MVDTKNMVPAFKAVLEKAKRREKGIGESATQMLAEISDHYSARIVRLMAEMDKAAKLMDDTLSDVPAPSNPNELERAAIEAIEEVLRPTYERSKLAEAAAIAAMVRTV